ncbi:MAG: hypothetical protein V7K67_32245 [Nostoc sp.]|uniref:hypothetical protein n=1 Tax=Nostoc sp. TaxID=1180 RepID=UPI002FF402CB
MKWTVEAVNERLKAGKIGVKVEARGDRLSLRATLPLKPGSDKTKPYQQYLALGIYANPTGLQRRGRSQNCRWAIGTRRVRLESISCR